MCRWMTSKNARYGLALTCGQNIDYMGRKGISKC